MDFNAERGEDDGGILDECFGAPPESCLNTDDSPTLVNKTSISNLKPFKMPMFKDTGCDLSSLKSLNATTDKNLPIESLLPIPVQSIGDMDMPETMVIKMEVPDENSVSGMSSGGSMMMETPESSANDFDLPAGSVSQAQDLLFPNTSLVTKTVSSSNISSSANNSVSIDSVVSAIANTVAIPPNFSESMHTAVSALANTISLPGITSQGSLDTPASAIATSQQFMSTIPSPKRARVVQTIYSKYKIIKEIESGVSRGDIIRKYGVKRSTLSDWLSKKDKIVELYESCELNVSRKANKCGKYRNIDRALYKWFTEAQRYNIPVNGSILQQKAKQFAALLNIKEFTASSGWFDRWKTRHGVSTKSNTAVKKQIAIKDTLIPQTRPAMLTYQAPQPRAVAPPTAVNSSCPMELSSNWYQSTLMPIILAKYRSEDIFTADEFGLIFAALPSNAMLLRCGGDIQTLSELVRITGLIAVNAVGEKLPLLIIGKSEKPMCFEGLQSLPCAYRHQNNVWMNANIFIEWVRSLDKKFVAEGRNIALLIDNCPAHPIIEGLKAINIIYFPLLGDAKLQPMSLGIVRSLKAHYRLLLVNKCIAHHRLLMNSLFRISLLDAINLVVQAWDDVSVATVINAFNKAGLFYGAPKTAKDDDQVMKQLAEGMEVLQGLDTNPAPATLTADVYVDLDSNIQTNKEKAMSDDEIIGELKVGSAETSDAIESISNEISDTLHNNPPLKPTSEDVENALDILKTHALFLKESAAAEVREGLRKIASNSSHS